MRLWAFALCVALGFLCLGKALRAAVPEPSALRVCEIKYLVESDNSYGSGPIFDFRRDAEKHLPKGTRVYAAAAYVVQSGQNYWTYPVGSLFQCSSDGFAVTNPTSKHIRFFRRTATVILQSRAMEYYVRPRERMPSELRHEIERKQADLVKTIGF